LASRFDALNSIIQQVLQTPTSATKRQAFDMPRIYKLFTEWPK
jgi:hypothetical protein